MPLIPRIGGFRVFLDTPIHVFRGSKIVKGSVGKSKYILWAEEDEPRERKENEEKKAAANYLKLVCCIEKPKETTLERTDFTLQLSMFVTAEK